MVAIDQLVGNSGTDVLVLALHYFQLVDNSGTDVIVVLLNQLVGNFGKVVIVGVQNPLVGSFGMAVELELVEKKDQLVVALHQLAVVKLKDQ